MISFGDHITHMNTSPKAPFFLEATVFSNCGQPSLGAARHLVGKEVPLHPLAASRSLIIRDVMKPYIDIYTYMYTFNVHTNRGGSRRIFRRRVTR